MKRLLPTAVLAFASCNPSPPPEPAVAVVDPAPKPQAEPKKETPEPAPPTVPPVVAVQPKKVEPPPPPPTFPFPKDEAGKLLPQVVAPPAPPAPNFERVGSLPKPRVAPARLLDPDALPKLVHAAPPVVLPRMPAAAPTAPAERVPLDLGFGAAAVPARPAFPEAPGIAIAARDVNLPPDLTPLGRQQPDRASLDDPTSEPGNATIAHKSPMPVLRPSGFLKVTLPDPFELGEQVKPKLAPAAEPSTAPVVVNPQRPK